MISASILGSVISLLFLSIPIAINIYIYKGDFPLNLIYFVFMGLAGFGFVLLGIIRRSRREFTNVSIRNALLKSAQDNKIISIKRKKIFITDESLSGKIFVSRRKLEQAIRDRSNSEMGSVNGVRALGLTR